MLILYNGSQIEMSEEFSFKDFTRHHVLIDIPDGTNVYASCFSKEEPDFTLFRPNMRNVTFYNCNMDNVRVPQPNNNQIIGGSNRRYKVQNDLNDWEIDITGQPTSPVDWKVYVKFGLPIPSPATIPLQRVAERVDLMAIAKGLS